MVMVDFVMHGDLLERELRDPAFRAEWERTAVGRAVAIAVVRFRGEKSLSQRALGELLGVPQPQISRLERGDHNPSIATLARLSAVMGVEFNIDIRPQDHRARLTTKRAQSDAVLASIALGGAAVSLSTLACHPPTLPDD